MSVRIRESVYSPANAATTLDWYSRAVAAMKNRAVDDPTSWWYWGARHGDPGLTRPANAATYWDQCQHQTWFFLSWHRGFLAAFEATVARAVADLGGPDDWALPYWNYSESLIDNPDARKLPAAFRDRFLADGTDNPLWAPRTTDADGNVGLIDSDVSLDALDETVFTDPAGFAPGFGGPATGFNRFGSQNGRLESTPHNILHVRIGGANGWMSDPDTAAFDPIFWLHHCNIDRLWDEWLVSDDLHLNPSADAWTTDIAFDLHDGDGNPMTFTSGETQDTTTFMHGYKYDSIPVPPFSGPLPPPTEGPTILADLEPELAGATEGPVALGTGDTRAPVRLSTESLSKSFTETALPTPVRVYLRLENVRGSGVPTDYDVLIDLDGDAEAPLAVGTLSTFGVAKASDPDGAHGGSGMTQVFEITHAAERLRLTEADTEAVRVTFRAREHTGQTEAVSIPGVAAPRDPGEASVEVGRVAIYFE